MTLTRATLGKLKQRKTLNLTIDGNNVRIQKPSPLEYSQYLAGMTNGDGKPDMKMFSASLALLTSRMWIDDEGNRLFADDESGKIVSEIDIDLYEKLSAECQNFAKPGASSALGESEKTIASDLPVESV